MTKSTQTSQSKPHLDALSAEIFARLTKQELNEMSQTPGSQASKLFGCTCGIIENGGGTMGVAVLKRTAGKHCWLIMRNCPLHKQILEEGN